MKTRYKALTQVALGSLLCLGLAIPANAQQRGGSQSTSGGSNSGGSGGGGGSFQPQRSSPPPAAAPSQPQFQRGAPSSYTPPAPAQQSAPPPQVQRAAPPSYSQPAQVQQSAPAAQVQRGAPQSYSPAQQPSMQRGSAQGGYSMQPQSNGIGGQFRPNASGSASTQRGGNNRAPLTFKPNNPGSRSSLYPNGSQRNSNTASGFNFRRGNNTAYRSYPGLRFGRNYVSPRPRGFFYRNRGYYQTYYMPQIGVNLSTLPYGYYPFYYGADQYYYNDGLYYTQQDDNYTVVEPPIGATIKKLPAKAQSITINGMQYYEYNGVYYQPVTKDDGTLVYQIAGKDGELNTVEEQGIAPEDLPQVGDLVDHLPEGFKILRLNNQRYYVSLEGYYFQDAVDVNGDPVFKIVATPYDTIEN